MLRKRGSGLGAGLGTATAYAKLKKKKGTKARRHLYRLPESLDMERSLWAIGNVSKFFWLCIHTVQDEPDAPYIMRNEFVDFVIKVLKVTSREEFDIENCKSFASELFLGTLPQHSFANNKMDFATFTSALWVLTKFFVSASSTWQIRGVWLGKVLNRTTQLADGGDPDVHANLFSSLGEWHDEYGSGAGEGFYDCNDVAQFYPVTAPVEICSMYEYKPIDLVVSDHALQCSRSEGAGGVAGPEEGRIFETAEMAEWESGEWMEAEEMMAQDDDDDEEQLPVASQDDAVAGGVSTKLLDDEELIGGSELSSRESSAQGRRRPGTSGSRGNRPGKSGSRPGTSGSRPGTSESASSVHRKLDTYANDFFEGPGRMMAGWGPWGNGTSPLGNIGGEKTGSGLIGGQATSRYMAAALARAESARGVRKRGYGEVQLDAGARQILKATCVTFVASGNLGVENLGARRVTGLGGGTGAAGAGAGASAAEQLMRYAGEARARNRKADAARSSTSLGFSGLRGESSGTECQEGGRHGEAQEGPGMQAAAWGQRACRVGEGWSAGMQDHGAGGRAGVEWLQRGHDVCGGGGLGESRAHASGTLAEASRPATLMGLDGQSRGEDGAEWNHLLRERQVPLAWREDAYGEVELGSRVSRMELAPRRHLPLCPPRRHVPLCPPRRHVPLCHRYQVVAPGSIDASSRPSHLLSDSASATETQLPRPSDLPSPATNLVDAKPFYVSDENARDEVTINEGEGEAASSRHNHHEAQSRRSILPGKTWRNSQDVANQSSLESLHTAVDTHSLKGASVASLEVVRRASDTQSSAGVGNWLGRKGGRAKLTMSSVSGNIVPRIVGLQKDSIRSLHAVRSKGAWGAGGAYWEMNGGLAAGKTSVRVVQGDSPLVGPWSPC